MTLEKQVKADSAGKVLLQQLPFDNANKDCQVAIYPIKETEYFMGYLKACHNTGTFKPLAAPEAFAIQNAKCLNCGKPGHLQKQCGAPPLTQKYGAYASHSHSHGLRPKYYQGWH